MSIAERNEIGQKSCLIGRAYGDEPIKLIPLSDWGSAVEVRRDGDRVRITAELIEARTDQHLWTDSYDRDLRDILSLQSQVAAAIANARSHAARLPFRPKVYFEEWDDPMISGIAWVSELIEIAGGIDVFADLAHCKSAKDRIVTGDQVIAREPDVIVGSWCGKKFRPEKVMNRAGFDELPAVRHGAVFEIKSPLILQPGPAALTDGLAALEGIIGNAAAAIHHRRRADQHNRRFREWRHD